MNIITSTSSKPYNEFFMETLNEFEKYNVRALAVIALTDDTQQVLTGYHNMSLLDKQLAKDNLEFDIIDEFLRNNADRYGIEMEGEDEDEV